ncbi:DUF4081 domain-containing protein [Occultella aeris]|uniref:Mycothiol acetyltransferase n=1 Tax=Occultella aeris TaxID=2761496 RepID=A0A7M4DP99_9MICO|nr:DUF4081 domain-containing GNAT family N-acetyltransferase [Occultella aeris]VZO39285.1 Mycothiol acetyltransferase [Occultella aeris]
MPTWPWRAPLQTHPDVVVQDARSADVAELIAFAKQDPVDAALLGEHVEAMSSYGFYRDQLLCIREPHGLTGLCWTGGNLVPLRLSDVAVEAVADHVRRRSRRFSSVVGPAHDVMRLWEAMRGFAPTPRDIRPDQPSMVIDGDPLVAPDPGVSLTSVNDLDLLLPACVAMFTEEVGYSPLMAGGGYERRVRSLVQGGRSLSRIDEGPEGRRVVFKAELGTVALGVTQVQGVWVHPDLRGQGHAVAGMAAVVAYARAQVAPLVSLYVNSYNAPALAAYRRVGFREVGTFATILF